MTRINPVNRILPMNANHHSELFHKLAELLDNLRPTSDIADIVKRPTRHFMVIYEKRKLYITATASGFGWKVLAVCYDPYLADFEPIVPDLTNGR